MSADCIGSGVDARANAGFPYAAAGPPFAGCSDDTYLFARCRARPCPPAAAVGPAGRGRPGRVGASAQRCRHQPPAGRFARADHTPALTQNLMGAIQQRMLPLFADLQKDLEKIVNEPAPAKKP
ncbi:Hypothetical protein XFF4834R_chr02180 [Xanthomonas citri pv. fuscans]|nr:Hypothetical protein XFF4834R_chr02180 [Xanthomonas citri pv. fuscans]